MTHIFRIAVVAAGVIAAVPAWAQPPIADAFNAGGGMSNAAQPPNSRAPGAAALRWLGGLGSTQSEAGPAPVTAGADRARRK